ASTLSDNQATGNAYFYFNGGTGGPGQGGGVYVASGVVNLDQSTLSGNQATGGYGGDFGGIIILGSGSDGGPGQGGGVYVASGAVDLAPSTLSGNQAHGASGGRGSATLAF